MMGLPDGFKKF